MTTDEYGSQIVAWRIETALNYASRTVTRGIGSRGTIGQPTQTMQKNIIFILTFEISLNQSVAGQLIKKPKPPYACFFLRNTVYGLLNCEYHNKSWFLQFWLLDFIHLNVFTKMLIQCTLEKIWKQRNLQFTNICRSPPRRIAWVDTNTSTYNFAHVNFGNVINVLSQAARQKMIYWTLINLITYLYLVQKGGNKRPYSQVAT